MKTTGANLQAATCPATIGFRLDHDSAKALAERAAQLGVSPHKLSQSLVVAALCEKQKVAELCEVVGALAQGMFQLREELALMAEVLLVHGGKMSSDKAQSWVDTNLKPD